LKNDTTNRLTIGDWIGGFAGAAVALPQSMGLGVGLFSAMGLRSEEDLALLDEHGDRIVYIELRGHLFFGTVDRLFTELATLLERPVWIVVNMRRVQSIDLTALDLFR